MVKEVGIVAMLGAKQATKLTRLKERARKTTRRVAKDRNLRKGGTFFRHPRSILFLKRLLSSHATGGRLSGSPRDREIYRPPAVAVRRQRSGNDVCC
jgi:hypothetical protein